MATHRAAHPTARLPLPQGRAGFAGAAVLLLVVTAGLVVLVAQAPPLGGAAALVFAAGTLVGATSLHRRSGTGIALVVLVVGGVVCAVIWPVAAILLAAGAAICAVALRAPALGLLGALLLVGSEGLLKARLEAEEIPSAIEFGALLIDFVLLVAFASLLRADRGASLRAVWRAGDRAEHVMWSLVGAWFVVSIVQIPFSPTLIDAVQGFRLTQAYVVVAVAGIALFAVAGPPRWRTPWLLGVFAIIGGYAALRAVWPPPAWEQNYAFERSEHASFAGEVLRDVGSFGSVVALASFLVPAGVFALIVGFLEPRVRRLAWIACALAAVGILMSYVRIAIVAFGIGTAVVAVLLIAGHGTPRRVRLLAVVITLGVGAGGFAAALAAGGVSSTVERRAQNLANPFGDESLRIRWRTWERSAEKTLNHPLGTGIGTVGHATKEGDRESYTDNAYLKLLQEQGIPVAALFIVGIFGTTVLLGRRLLRAGPLREPVAVAALGAFVSFLVLCLIGEYIELPGKALAWTLLGVALWGAYGRRRRSEDRMDGEADGIDA
jgi:hypothetical protein